MTFSYNIWVTLFQSHSFFNHFCSGSPLQIIGGLFSHFFFLVCPSDRPCHPVAGQDCRLDWDRMADQVAFQKNDTLHSTQNLYACAPLLQPLHLSSLPESFCRIALWWQNISVKSNQKDLTLMFFIMAWQFAPSRTLGSFDMFSF